VWSSSALDGDVGPLREVIESTGAESITPRRGVARPGLAGARWTLAGAGVSRIPCDIWLRERCGRASRIYVLVRISSWSPPFSATRQFMAESAKLIKDGLWPEEWLTMAEVPRPGRGPGDPKGKGWFDRRGG